jgi:adenosylmethionine-8-amino-7-oxononanoate aminotransferase
MEHSYHGDTIGAMSVGARGVFNQAYEKLLFDVGTIPFPAAGCEQATLDALDDACRAEPVAAFIVEPLVLGAGGMLMYSPDTLRAMHAICEKHGVLFIADEVMTGWGRTGTLLACEQADITPDIVCLAKGITGGSLPLAVTLATPAIFEAHWSTDPAKQFFHSSSYTANPIACAAANANLQIWRDEPVRKRIARLTERQAVMLGELAKLPRVANARQCGTIIALDVVDAEGAGYLSEIGPRLRESFRNAPVLLRPLGNTVYVMPPYCIGEEDLAIVRDAIAEAVSTVAS